MTVSSYATNAYNWPLYRSRAEAFNTCWAYTFHMSSLRGVYYWQTTVQSMFHSHNLQSEDEIKNSSSYKSTITRRIYISSSFFFEPRSIYPFGVRWTLEQFTSVVDTLPTLHRKRFVSCIVLSHHLKTFLFFSVTGELWWTRFVFAHHKLKGRVQTWNKSSRISSKLCEIAWWRSIFLTLPVLIYC